MFILRRAIESFLFVPSVRTTLNYSATYINVFFFYYCLGKTYARFITPAGRVRYYLYYVYGNLYGEILLAARARARNKTV